MLRFMAVCGRGAGGCGLLSVVVGDGQLARGLISCAQHVARQTQLCSRWIVGSARSFRLSLISAALAHMLNQRHGQRFSKIDIEL